MTSNLINCSTYINYLSDDDNNFAANCKRDNGDTGSNYIKMITSISYIIDKLNKVYNNLSPVISKTNNNILEVVIQETDLIKFDKLSTFSLTNKQYHNILEASLLLQDLSNNYIKDNQEIRKIFPKQSYCYQQNFIVNLVYETTYQNFKPTSKSFIKKETLDTLISLYNSLQSSIYTLNEIVKFQKQSNLPVEVSEPSTSSYSSRDSQRGFLRLRSDLIFNINKLKENKLAVLIEESENSSNSNTSNIMKLRKSNAIVNDTTKPAVHSCATAIQCMFTESGEMASKTKTSKISVDTKTLSVSYGTISSYHETSATNTICYKAPQIYTGMSPQSSLQAVPLTMIDSMCSVSASIPFQKKLSIKSKSLCVLQEDNYNLSSCLQRFENMKPKSFCHLDVNSSIFPRRYSGSLHSLSNTSIKYSKEDANDHLENLEKKIGYTYILLHLKPEIVQFNLVKVEKDISSPLLSIKDNTSSYTLHYTEGNTTIGNSSCCNYLIDSVTHTVNPIFGQATLEENKSFINISQKFSFKSTIALHPKDSNILSLNTKRKETRNKNNQSAEKLENCSNSKKPFLLFNTKNSKDLENRLKSNSLENFSIKQCKLKQLSRRYHKQSSASKCSIKFVKTVSDYSLLSCKKKHKNINDIKENDVPYEASNTSLPIERTSIKISKKNYKKKNNKKLNLNDKQYDNKQLETATNKLYLCKENNNKTLINEKKLLSKFTYYTNLENSCTYDNNGLCNIYNCSVKNTSYTVLEKTTLLDKETKLSNPIKLDRRITSTSKNADILASYINYANYDLPWGQQKFEVRIVEAERKIESESANERRVSTVSELSGESGGSQTNRKSRFYDYPEITSRESSLRDVTSQQRSPPPFEIQYANQGRRESVPLPLRPWAPLNVSDVSLPREDMNKKKSSDSTKKKPGVSSKMARSSDKESPLLNQTPAVGPFQLVPIALDPARNMVDTGGDPRMIAYVLADLNQVQPLQSTIVGNSVNRSDKQLTDRLCQTCPPARRKNSSTQTCRCESGGNISNLPSAVSKNYSSKHVNNMTQYQQTPCTCKSLKQFGCQKETPIPSTSGLKICAYCAKGLCEQCKGLNKKATHVDTYYSLIHMKTPKLVCDNKQRMLLKYNYLYNGVYKTFSEDSIKNKIRNKAQSKSLSKIYSSKLSLIDKRLISLEKNNYSLVKTNTEKLIKIVNKKEENVYSNWYNKLQNNSDTIFKLFEKIKLKSKDNVNAESESMYTSDPCPQKIQAEEEKKSNNSLSNRYKQEKILKHSLLKKMMNYDNKYEKKSESEVIESTSRQSTFKLKHCPSQYSICSNNLNTNKNENYYNKSFELSDGNITSQKNSLRNCSCYLVHGNFDKKPLKCLSNFKTLHTKSKKLNLKTSEFREPVNSSTLRMSYFEKFFSSYSLNLDLSIDNLANLKYLKKISNCKYANHFSNSDSQLHAKVNKIWMYDNMESVCSNIKGYQNDKLEQFYVEVNQCYNYINGMPNLLKSRSETNLLIPIDQKLKKVDIIMNNSHTEGVETQLSLKF